MPSDFGTGKAPTDGWRFANPRVRVLEFNEVGEREYTAASQERYLTCHVDGYRGPVIGTITDQFNMQIDDDSNLIAFEISEETHAECLENIAGHDESEDDAAAATDDSDDDDDDDDEAEVELNSTRAPREMKERGPGGRTGMRERAGGFDLKALLNLRK